MAAAPPPVPLYEGDRGRGGGKSGLRRAGRSLTATGSNPRERATENKPPR